MFKRIKEDENLRQWWWAHLLHWLQGWFVASLVAEGWPWVVAAAMMGAGLWLYQKVEYDVLKDRTGRGDRIIRDWKIITFGFTAGLIYCLVTGWTLVAWMRLALEVFN